MLSPIQVPVGNSQIACHWIKHGIADGRYNIGYRLVLSQIVREADNSMVPVRKAVCLLEAERAGDDGAPRRRSSRDSAPFRCEPRGRRSDRACRAAYYTPAMKPLHSRRDERLCGAHRFALVHVETSISSRPFEVAPTNISSIPHIANGTGYGFLPGRAQQSVEEHGRLLQPIKCDAVPCRSELAAHVHHMATLNSILKHLRKFANGVTNGSTTRKAAER
jgi:hypothetical protein